MLEFSIFVIFVLLASNLNVSGVDSIVVQIIFISAWLGQDFYNQWNRMVICCSVASSECVCVCECADRSAAAVAAIDATPLTTAE